MSNFREFQKFIASIDEGSGLMFLLVAADEEKDLKRSFENEVNVINHHPMMVLRIIGAGDVGNTKGQNRKPAIFFTPVADLGESVGDEEC